MDVPMPTATGGLGDGSDNPAQVGVTQGKLLFQSCVSLRTTHTCTAQLEQEINEGSCEMLGWVSGEMIQ